MKYIFFLLLFLMSFQCSTKKNILESFKNPKLKVDATIKSQPLKLIETVHIEETPYLILSDIYDVQFNPDTTQILITDPANRTANLYNYKTGKIINWIRAGVNLSDSIAYSKKKGPIPNLYYHFRKYKYLKINDCSNYKISQRDIQMHIQNHFYRARYINDNIYFLTSVNVIAITKDSIKRITNNAMIVICNNKLKILKTINLDILHNSFPLPFGFIYNNISNKFYITSYDRAKYDYYKIFDSLALVSEYDSKGKFLKIVSYLPKKFTDNKIGNLSMSMVYFVLIKNKVFITTPYDLSIYDFKKKSFHNKMFDFHNLPLSNDSGFTYYQYIKSKMKERKYQITYEKQQRIMETLFPIRIVNAMNVKNNIGIHLVVFDSTQKLGYYYILQEYSTAGKLLSQTNIYDDPDNRIKYITFDNKNNCLVIFKKSKKGWTMGKRQWL